MIDNEITFIVHLRKDCEERKKNVDIAIPYYTTLVPNSKFIIVEDDAVKNFEYLGDIKNIQYIHSTNTGVYNKCKSYNIGLQHATTDIVCFLDIDCIVSDINLSKSIEIAYKNDSINIAYNGVAIYLDYTAKSQIDTKTGIQIYDYFESLVDRANLYNEFKTEYYTVGNVKAVGGCLMGKRKVFNQINGFNPNFIGWGFEDNEIISRARILNIPLNYINTPKSFLFHLPHEKDQKNDKSAHDFYQHNYTEISKVTAMSKEALEQYIKTWQNNTKIHTLKGIGMPFNHEHSSCSVLTPEKFKWVLGEGDYDIYIDYGMKKQEPNLQTPKEKRFGWFCESKFIIPDVFDWLVKNHEILFEKYYYKIFTCEQELLNLNANFVYAYAGSNFPWVKRELWDIYPKTKLCSMICSPKILTQEHAYRQQVAQTAVRCGVDVFGPTFKPLYTHLANWDAKIYGIKDYMFHIIVENGVSENYFTEKVTDAIAVGSIPVYRGAPKVLELFDPNGIIVLEPGREEEIINNLTEELYNSKLQAVKNNLEILKSLKLSDDYLFDCITSL